MFGVLTKQNTGYLIFNIVTVNLLTKTATKQRVGRQFIYSMDTLDKGMIYLPGGSEWKAAQINPTTQIRMQFKTYESFISEVFLLKIFLDQSLW